MLIVTDKDLPKLTEADLLKIVILQYELDHPNIKALYEFSKITGLSEDCINNARSGKGHIGIEAWNKINSEIFYKWFDTKRKRQ